MCFHLCRDIWVEDLSEAITLATSAHADTFLLVGNRGLKFVTCMYTHIAVYPYYVCPALYNTCVLSCITYMYIRCVYMCAREEYFQHRTWVITAWEVNLCYMYIIILKQQLLMNFICDVCCENSKRIAHTMVEIWFADCIECMFTKRAILYT